VGGRSRIVLLKHQILISNRTRRRAPNLTLDRCVLALTTLFVSPRGIPKLGALVKLTCPGKFRPLA
jgi:hypothetical protein